MVKVGEVNRLADVYKWNITRIADAFNMDRGTVRRRIRDAGLIPAGTINGVSVYALKDIGPALFGDVLSAPGTGPDDMMPTDRKAWYQSENERIKLEKEMRLLVPVEEVHLEMSRLARSVASGLDSLADILERDAGLAPDTIELVQNSTDALREQMYRAVVEDDPDPDE